MTFYYKDDVLLKQESVENYTLSKIDADNPLELLKNSSAEDEKNTKILSVKVLSINQHTMMIFSLLLIHSITLKPI